MKIPKDHNLSTGCPAWIKALITQFEDAAQAFAFKGAAHPDDHDRIVEAAQVARYNLEQAIACCIGKGG